MRRSLSLRGALMDLSIPKKLGIIVGLFCGVVVLLLALSYFGMEMLASGRAYIAGEGLWSKAQQDAVLRLGRYSWSRNEDEYALFRAALNIPLGDKYARLELEKKDPNLAFAEAGFLQGGNHPEDIPGMIWVFQNLNQVNFVRQAIEFWRQADAHIQKLEEVGAKIHQEITSSPSSPQRLEKLLIEVQDINAAVRPLEDGFSATLGEGVRWLKNVLLGLMLATTGIFLAAALGVAFLISRHLGQEINQLRHSAARVAAGDYSIRLNVESHDEIGDLARTFQQMAIQRQSAERLKDELYAKAAAANQEMEAFSYSVSHDLRSPLRAIEGFSRELQDNCEKVLNDRSKEDLRLILSATQRMGQLIDDLLKLSHLSRGDLVRQRLNVSAMAAEVVAGLRLASPQRSVDVHIAPGLFAEADPNLVRIVFENLLGNAWKFTQRTPQARIEVGSKMEEGQTVFQVRDNGVGFDMGYVHKLFVAFQRLHGEHEFPGSGIGLAIVSRIVQRHGGTIRAEGAEGQGATFSFTLASPPH